MDSLILKCNVIETDQLYINVEKDPINPMSNSANTVLIDISGFKGQDSHSVYLTKQSATELRDHLTKLIDSLPPS